MPETYQPISADERLGLALLALFRKPAVALDPKDREAAEHLRDCPEATAVHAGSYWAMCSEGTCELNLAASADIECMHGFRYLWFDFDDEMAYTTDELLEAMDKAAQR